MNCYCQSDFDLRVICQPLDDYRKLKKYSNGLKYDFRKCPQRFNYAMDFVLNHCEYVRLIEGAQTKTGKKTIQRRFIVARKILIRKYRLPKLEAERAIMNYRYIEDNIIDGPEIFEYDNNDYGCNADDDDVEDLLAEYEDAAIDAVRIG